MKYLKKSLCAVLSIGIITGSVIGPGTYALAQTTATPVVDSTAPVGTITKVMVTFCGDATTQKGFTWYTSTASINSDLQIVEKTTDTTDFTNAVKFTGNCAVPSNNTAAPAPAGTTTSKLEFLHKAEATGLKANTTYFYRIGDASLNLWSTGTFQTAPTSGAFTFIDVADPQAKDYDEGLLAASTFQKALDTVPDSKFIELNGDIVDKGSVEYEWDWLFNNIGQKFLNTTIAPIAGNHDEYNGCFLDHFDLAPAQGSDTTTGVYYSHDYSNAHFVMLNCNETSANDLSPAQITWLTNDITNAKANGAKWIIVNMHKGPYSTSNHATDIDLAGPNGARQTLSPLFAQLGVDLVLQGHDHIYARSKPIKADNTAAPETLSTELFQGHNIQYEVNPGAPVYLIPATAGPKVYYKNQSIITNPAANGYDPNFYNLFDVADENHAAIYGAAVGDATRPERKNIQTFESITVDSDKLSVISYEIDQNRDNATPYIIDSFGLKK
ncbi:MAG: metallophosphoesterase family protein [Desulfosporosinus sp.]|nr:metallophosphoesterase family protein [Desulfosporosinus sp.]